MATTTRSSKQVIIINMAVTAFQAASGVFAAAGFKLDKLVIGAAVGAALSALYNVYAKPYLRLHGWMK